ncbi:probable LRR receptor-like serine/threonine-protein kinase At1g51880 [Typha angustifolia]|uniref:probable LRR receptor-like serine/threonine-protein kinase At1g51880 n=1 Tax=Typha angustifolia TaxID=59011 RepID=UPI003C2EEB95
MWYLSLEKKMVKWWPLLLGVLIAAVQVHGQTPSTDGFISIDCGAADGYTDRNTSIPYTTDDQFINTGINYNVASNYINLSLPKQYTTVRSFPDGDRNCYTLKPVTKGFKYLVRATFMYGNYDGRRSVQSNSQLLFDLHIGVTTLKTMNISDAAHRYTSEIIMVALADLISVCLIKTGSSTPFISSLELRPLKATIYPMVDDSEYLILFGRANLGSTTDMIIRYPDDRYDRLWKPFTDNAGRNVISTASKVSNYLKDMIEAPTAVLQTAVTSTAVNKSIQFYWIPEAADPVYYVGFHFSELQVLSSNDVREFNIFLNGELWFDHMRPPYLMADYVYAELRRASTYNFSLVSTTNATLPPLINAIEVFSLVSLVEVMTNLDDVHAMLAIKAAYKVKKNWMGDPCFPKQYVWDGITCSNGGNDSRIIALNLSSSGLDGEVSTSFSRLTAIMTLDLSYNNLSGKIPDSLADISSLEVLTLTGNCFTEIPDALIERSKDGSLTLRFDNFNKCNGRDSTPDGNSSTATQKKITTPIIIVLSVVPAILLVVAVYVVWRVTRKPQVIIASINHEKVRLEMASGSHQHNVDCGCSQFPSDSHQFSVDCKDSQLPLKSRQFMYTELEYITNNFAHTLGKGGFGTVFHGFLEGGTEVAVKMCSLSSEQAPNLFLAEVQNLSRVRHRNLVSLVGYCMDRCCMAIVYEYMPLGSLQDHLKGKTGVARVLSWAERLRIVLDAAQGLDYLYNGCPMPIIHRDVKTSNILLGQNLEAKVSDFGLSKAFHSDLQTHVSMTALAFSPGYVDPMCLQSWKFNEKTDVYSFGVVLLEIITGEPPIRCMGDVHLIERVQQSFRAGDIDAIVDAMLQGMYNADSVWKVAELALNCTGRAINQRPKMAEVVAQLRKILELETAGRSKNMTGENTASRQDIAYMKESAIFSPSAR